MTPVLLRLTTLLLLCLLALPGRAQQASLPWDTLALDDLRAFRPAADNWQVAGGVASDRHVEGDLHPLPGTGVLVNVPGDAARDNLFTAWEHGDIELELSFLVPKGSNSGIYLMGRYEVQVFDSWGVPNPRYLDAGAIYERWDERRPADERGYEGHPPRVNASRAPGLWQRFHIVFRAPRFDDQGKKIADARFVKVVHNGVVVQENVDVTGPTRAAAFTDEQPTGPLMIQGDHGPVALRDIHYKRYGSERVRLSDLRYRYYEGQYNRLADLDSLPSPLAEGTADRLSPAVAQRDDQFALVFEGNMTVPETGWYLFDLGMGWVDDDPHFSENVVGTGRLLIDDQVVLVHEGHGPHAAETVTLQAGQHPFRLLFFKNRGGSRPAVTLDVEGPGQPRHALHDEATLPPSQAPSPIPLDVAREPVVQRGFIRFGDEKLTHAVAVGDPQGVHYAYDLDKGALLLAWRGPFADVTDMWHSRGVAQLAEPLGSVLTLSGQPAVAPLASPEAAWPDSLPDYRFRRYELGPDGRPTFYYQVGAVTVADHVAPGDTEPVLRRTIHLSGAVAQKGLYALLAVGDAVEPLAGGGYSVDGRTYYVEAGDDGAAPIVRASKGKKELVVPVRFDGNEGTVSYAIVW